MEAGPNGVKIKKLLIQIVGHRPYFLTWRSWDHQIASEKAKFIFSVILFRSALFIGACSPGYVKEEPVYQERARPERPGNTHIWVGGDWIYSRKTRNYSQQNGHWAAPRRGRTYVPGHWNTSPRGHQWKQGHWR